MKLCYLYLTYILKCCPLDIPIYKAVYEGSKGPRMGGGPFILIVYKHLK